MMEAPAYVEREMFDGKQKGQEALLAYVVPRSCSTHDAYDELQAMKNIHLTVFKLQKKESKKLKLKLREGSCPF